MSGVSTPFRPRRKRRTPCARPSRATPSLAVVTAKVADADWLAMALSRPAADPRRTLLRVRRPRSRPRARQRGPVAHRGPARPSAPATTAPRSAACWPLIACSRPTAIQRCSMSAPAPVCSPSRRRAPARASQSARDIDAISVRIANENARVNQARARFAHADGLTHPLIRANAPYNLVFANILARPLVQLAQPIADALRPGGHAILSGLLHSQSRQVFRRLSLARVPYREADTPRRLATLVLNRP